MTQSEQTESADSATEPRPRRFALRWWCGLVLLSWVAAVLAVILRAGGLGPIENWGAVGAPIFVLILISTLFAWLAFAIARRSVLAASITFCLVASLIGAFDLRTLLRAADLRKDRQLTAQFSDQLDAALSDQLARLEKGELALMDPAAQQGLHDTLKQRAEGTDGAAAVARVQLAFFDRATELAAPIGAAMGEFAKSGGVAPKSLSSPEAIRERAAAARRLVDMSKELDAAIRTLPGFIDAELERNQVPVAIRMQTREELLLGFKPALQHRLRDANQRCMSAAAELLSLLDRTYGAWSYVEDRNQLIFREPADLQAYNAIVKEVQSTEEEQRSIQRAILSSGR